MRLFLDSSFLLAACGSAAGASREIFRSAGSNGWTLIATAYVLEEVSRNLADFPAPVIDDWAQLNSSLSVVKDVVTLDRPHLLQAAKDRPI